FDRFPSGFYEQLRSFLIKLLDIVEFFNHDVICCLVFYVPADLPRPPKPANEINRPLKRRSVMYADSMPRYALAGQLMLQRSQGPTSPQRNSENPMNHGFPTFPI